MGLGEAAGEAARIDPAVGGSGEGWGEAAAEDTTMAGATGEPGREEAWRRALEMQPRQRFPLAVKRDNEASRLQLIIPSLVLINAASARLH